MAEKPTYEALEKRVAELEQLIDQNNTARLQNLPELLFALMDAFRYIPLCKTFKDAAKEIFHQCKRLTGAQSGYVALLSENGKEKFRRLYDEASVGYFEYELQGNITQVNRTELQMLGYTAEEMIGQPCWKFIVDEVACEQILAKLGGVRPPAVGLEHTYRRKDGSTFPVLFEDRLLLDNDGHITGIRTAIQDITYRKRVVIYPMDENQQGQKIS